MFTRMRTARRWPVRREALPKGNLAFRADGHHPRVSRALGLGARANERTEPEAQQKAAQQHRVVLTILPTKQTHGYNRLQLKLPWLATVSLRY